VPLKVRHFEFFLQISTLVQGLETMLRYLADVEVEESVTAMDNAAKYLAAS
jgi:hypothetical protein